jgi:nucleoside diphosphate kinase
MILFGRSDEKPMFTPSTYVHFTFGILCAMFAKSIDANAMHGSDSDENAEIESNFFFSQLERF